MEGVSEFRLWYALLQFRTVMIPLVAQACRATIPCFYREQGQLTSEANFSNHKGKIGMKN